MTAWREQPGRAGDKEPVRPLGAAEPREPGDRDHIVVVPGGQRLNWRRGILVGASLISALIVIVMIAVWVLTGTDWGRERVRRYAVTMLNGMIHGRATIGSLSGNLLVGMTVHDLTITDSAGTPFVAVESFTAHYSILGLLRKRIWLDHAVAVRPLIVLDRPPHGTWNWQRIFPRDTTPKPPSTQTQWGDWLRFTDASVVNGQLIVLSPWSPSARLRPAAQDSVVRQALGGGTRLMIERVKGGFQKRVQLDSVTATIPFLRLSQPGFKNRLLQVSALSMNAFPFRAPGAVVRNLMGTFPFTNDSIWWTGAYAELPHSKASGDGSYLFSSGDMTLFVHSDPASFADMRWVYPRLPADGHGKLDLALKWRGALQDYQISNADIAMGPARAAGAFGITLGDTITIHDTDLRFSDLDTRTLEQLIPGLRSPRRGVLAGRAKASGGRHALAVNGDVTFDDQRAGHNRVIAVGGIGFLDGGGVAARDLRLQMLPVQVDLARTWDPTLPIGGTVTGTATLNGSTKTELAAAMNVTHRDRGAVSALRGTASVRLSGPSRIVADVTTEPISLVEIGRFFPSAGLQGSASGPVHLAGSLGDLRLRTDLRLPDGGRFAASGTFDLASRTKGYDVAASLYTLNLRTIDSKAPVTSLTARVTAAGRGFELATLRSTIVADLSTSRWDSIAVDSMSIRARVADGLASIQKLYASGAHTRANIAGSFGLVRGRSGELTYVVDVDSLGALDRWIPKSAGSTKAVAPRPRVVARAVAQARADSVRADRATEMARMITGAPGPKLVVNTPKPVPRDTLAGSVHLAGRLSGNLYDFDLRGRAAGDSVYARGNFVRSFMSEYAWTDARTPQSKLAVGLDAGGVSAMGFGFDTLNARLSYASPGGHVEVAVSQGDNRQYAAKGDYAFYPDRNELRLTDMTFRFDTAYWSMPHPGTIQWGGAGIRVTDFELRNRSNGRVYANGLLPTKGVADFMFEVDNFPVSNVADIVQTDVAASGLVTMRATMAGTLSNPSFRGAFGLVQGTYNGTPVPALRARFGYADRELVTHVEALRTDTVTHTVVATSDSAMMTVDARLPIDLAFTGVTGDRLLPLPMSVDLVGDSLPIDLIPQFTDLVSNVHGHAAGRIAMRGTLRRPVLVGAAAIDHATAMINSTGAMIDNIVGRVRMANDTVYLDTLSGTAKGAVSVHGTLAVGDWRTPSFNLFLVSSGARLMNNDYADLRLDAGLALTGPYDRAYLSGAVTVDQGVIYAPEPQGRHLIGAGDPALFNVLDTTVDAERNLFPPKSPLIANLRMEVTVGVKRNTWVRNREANVEIHTDDPVFVRDEQQAFLITGVVSTDRGEYAFMSKRFQIQRGSAMFIGSPDLNPTLQITGEYQVEVASRGALNIRVVVGGTLKHPNLSLESDAQPPKTQSELLSLLAFGQSTTSLVASTTSSIAGSAATLDLFGVGAQVAARRLASVALGVAVQQVQMQAGRVTGVDVFDITPADVPTELVSGRGIGNFFTQTRIEAGKYINPRTFVSVQEQAVNFGGTIEHRTADGWRFNATIEPRLVLLEPTLNSQPFRTVRSYGGFIIREWRF